MTERVALIKNGRGRRRRRVRRSSRLWRTRITADYHHEARDYCR